MNCIEAKQLMHEMLDDKSFTKDSNLLEKHCVECPSCSQLWLEMQFLENQLLGMEEVEIPVDFSELNWLPAEPRLSKWLVALIGGVSILAMLVWGLVTLWNLPAFDSVTSILFNLIPSGAMITQGIVSLFKNVIMAGATLLMFIRLVLAITFAHPVILFMTTAPVIVLLFYLIKLSRQASLQ